MGNGKGLPRGEESDVSERKEDVCGSVAVPYACDTTTSTEALTD
jgi:hypothetical protein